jgi:hypothetical protein
MKFFFSLPGDPTVGINSSSFTIDDTDNLFYGEDITEEDKRAVKKVLADFFSNFCDDSKIVVYDEDDQKAENEYYAKESAEAKAYYTSEEYEKSNKLCGEDME